MMTLNAFINDWSVPKALIGGYYIRGHDENDEFQEFVVVGSEWPYKEVLGRVRHWIDWVATDLEIGNPLLGGETT